MVRFFQMLIKIYSYLVSPLFGRSCRYHPTCSAYAMEALEKHGVIKGFFLTIKRILSCHPYCRKNYDDPVPKQFDWKHQLGYKRLCCDKKMKNDDEHSSKSKGLLRDE